MSRNIPRLYKILPSSQGSGKAGPTCGTGQAFGGGGGREVDGGGGKLGELELELSSGHAPVTQISGSIEVMPAQ